MKLIQILFKINTRKTKITHWIYFNNLTESNQSTLLLTTYLRILINSYGTENFSHKKIGIAHTNEIFHGIR